MGGPEHKKTQESVGAKIKIEIQARMVLSLLLCKDQDFPHLPLKSYEPHPIPPVPASIDNVIQGSIVVIALNLKEYMKYVLILKMNNLG